MRKWNHCSNIEVFKAFPLKKEANSCLGRKIEIKLLQITDPKCGLKRYRTSSAMILSPSLEAMYIPCITHSLTRYPV